MTTPAPNVFERHPAAWAWAVVLLGSAVRIWFTATGQLNLVQDEAQYWDWSRTLQLTYYSKGPLIAWWIAAWTAVFGSGELGVRLGAIALGAAGQGLVYGLARRLSGRAGLGLLALVAWNSLPMSLAYSLLMTTDSLFLFFWTAGLVVLARILGAGGPPAKDGLLEHGLLALVLACGILSKYTMLGFIPLALLCAALGQRLGLIPRVAFGRLVAAMLAGLALGFLPTLVWNVQHGLVGYRHVLTLIGVSGEAVTSFLRPDRFVEHAAAQLGVLTPWWLGLIVLASLGCLKAVLGTREAPCGLGPCAALFALVFFWPVFLFFLFWGLHSKVYANWSVISVAAGCVLGALGFERLSGKWSRRLVLGLSALVFVLAHVQQILPLPPNLAIADRLKGFEDLGWEVERLKTTKCNNPQQVFVFSELYDLTAALSFYVPGQARAYCVWADERRMNQYDLWPGPEDKVGWDAVYVRKRYAGWVPAAVERMFAAIEGPHHFQTWHKGRPARDFTLFVCRRYTGFWPRPEHATF
jgi:4-amino-4-deoxy-L-arabinose transferase-like glycosyltransferase